MELSKNKVKLINSLQKKKYREINGLFVAEGKKLVHEILKSGLQTEIIVGTTDWYSNENEKLLLNVKEIIETTQKNISKISSLSTSPEVLAVVKIPKVNHDIEEIISIVNDNLSLFLDKIQDPGNLGTILRIADWFGIKNVICLQGCVDVFSPKTIQATMGAICRIKTYNLSTDNVFSLFDKIKVPVYGTFLEGNNIYNEKLSTNGLIVMGNEANGISPEISGFITQRLLIPAYPLGESTSESLNVSVAAAIVCSEFRRREAVNLSK